MGYRTRSGTYWLEGTSIWPVHTKWTDQYPRVWGGVRIYNLTNVFLGTALFPDMAPKLPKKGGDMQALQTAIASTQRDLSKKLEDTQRLILSNKNHVDDTATITSHKDVQRTIAIQQPATATHLLSLPWQDLSVNQPGQTLMNSRLTTQVDSVNKGIQGEQLTARILDVLPGYRTIHSIPLRTNKDLDHVAIGRSGIFIIDSKNIIAGYQVDGRQTWYQGNGTWQNYEIQNDLIKTDDLIHQRLRNRGYRDVADLTHLVHKVIVMWNGQAMRRTPDAAEPTDVKFIAGSALKNWMYDDVAHPAIIDDNVVNALYDDMRRSTFWI